MKKIIESAKRISEKAMKKDILYPSYTNDLTLEGLLSLYVALKEEKYVNYVLNNHKKRNIPNKDLLNWKQNPFTCLSYEIYEVTGDASFIDGFVDEAYRYRKEALFTKEGMLAHRKNTLTLIDNLQAYATWMARAGYISGDESFFEECVKQYRLYTESLLDENGLYSQGRGWADDESFISPGAWCRGQGWVIKGMVESLKYLPKHSSYHKEMKTYMTNFSRNLMKFQDKRGMWHQLVEEMCSYPETSGSSLIAYSLNISKLSEEASLSAQKCVEALVGFVKNGNILNCSFGTGPLQTKEAYRYRVAIVSDTHAAGCVLLAFSSYISLQN